MKNTFRIRKKSQAKASQTTSLLEPQSAHLEATSWASTYAHAATSANTRTAYRSDIRHFIAWGGVLPTTPDVIIRYLETYAQSLHPNTLNRRLTALKHWHTYQHFPDPTAHPVIRKTLAGIARVHGRAQTKAKPLGVAHIAQLTQHGLKKDRLIDWRNNALLLVGFFGAFRRSELVAIQWEQVHFVSEGVEIVIPRSKTDQEGEGVVCALPFGNPPLCPVLALRQWQQKSNRKTGPVFVKISKGDRLLPRALAPASVSLILKNLIEACQLPDAKQYSAHSLRRGFATAASKKGASLNAIMHHGRWLSERTVLGYIEEGQRFHDNVAGLLMEEMPTIIE